MEGLKLVKPNRLDISAIQDFRNEFITYNERNINGTAGLISYDNIQDWLKMIEDIEYDKLTKQNVNATTFLSVDESSDRIIGSIQLRHSLSPELETHGGHIGYGIRPTERGKGYGKAQLQLILKYAHGIGLDKVLLTCDKENERSRKTIESCGGILKNESLYKGKVQLNYWITLD